MWLAQWLQYNLEQLQIFGQNDNLPDATIVAYADFPSVTASISNGEAHYAMGDSPVLALAGDLMVTFSDETFGIAVDDGDSELLAAMNVAITAVIDSGEYDLIFGAWFDGAGCTN